MSKPLTSSRTLRAGGYTALLGVSYTLIYILMALFTDAPAEVLAGILTLATISCGSGAVGTAAFGIRHTGSAAPTSDELAMRGPP